MEFLQSFLRHPFKETSVGVAKYQLFPPSNAKIWHLFMGGGCLQQVPIRGEITGKLILVFWMVVTDRGSTLFIIPFTSKVKIRHIFQILLCKILKTDNTT